MFENKTKLLGICCLKQVWMGQFHDFQALDLYLWKCRLYNLSCILIVSQQKKRFTTECLKIKRSFWVNVVYKNKFEWINFIIFAPNFGGNDMYLILTNVSFLNGSISWFSGLALGEGPNIQIWQLCLLFFKISLFSINYYCNCNKNVYVIQTMFENKMKLLAICCLQKQI